MRILIPETLPPGSRTIAVAGLPGLAITDDCRLLRGGLPRPGGRMW
jgi:hypothetical protein